VKREHLSDLLAGAGYSRIQLERMRTGQMLIDAHLGDAAVTMMLDSGASATVLDSAAAARIGLSAQKPGDTAAGAGGVLTTSTADVDNLKLAELNLGPRSITIMDFRHVNEQLTALGEVPPDGVLGADVLHALNAVLDYTDPSLYIRPTGTDTD